MKYRSLLPDGPDASVLGLGLWPLTGAMGPVDTAAAEATIEAALDHGITVFDASRNAPISEQLIGRVIRGDRRAKCIIATKAYPGDSQEGLRSAVEKSLVALQTDRIDLFQLQGWYPQMPIEKVVIDAHELVDEGKVGVIGVCNFDASILESASQGGAIATNALEHNLLQRSAEEEDFVACERLGVSVIAHSALAKGLLSGRYKRGHKFDSADERARFSDVRRRLEGGQLDELTMVAEGAGRPLRELAIAWLISRPAVKVTLIGAKSPEQIAQNVQAIESSLDEVLMKKLDAVTAPA